METGSDRQPEANAPASAGTRSPRRSQIGVRGLILAVACFGFISWAARALWESQHPVVAAARGLRSTDPAERAGAARLLISLGTADPDRAIPPLIDALDDSDAEVRLSAVASVGAISGHLLRSGSAGPLVQSGVGALIGALRDREPSVRIAAVSALHSMVTSSLAGRVIDVPAAAEAVAATLADRDERVRKSGLVLLTQLGPMTNSGPPASLVAALDDRSAEVRAAAITALAAFPGDLDPWMDALFRDVEHGEPEVRKACWWAIGRNRKAAFSAEAIPRLVKAMGHPDRNVRSYAARALYSHQGDPHAAAAIPALLTLLREPIEPRRAEAAKPGQVVYTHDQEPADVAAGVLGRVAPGTSSAGEVIAALAEVVRSGHPSRRMSAIEALGEFGPAAEPAVPVLIRAVREHLASRPGQPDYAYGGPAVRALGQIAPGTQSAEEVLGVLIDALPSDPKIPSINPLFAIEALGAFGPAAARAIPRLREYQKGPDVYLRFAAEKALAAIEVAGQAGRGRTPGR